MSNQPHPSSLKAPHSGQINVKINPVTHAMFAAACDKRGVSQRHVIEHAIEVFNAATHSVAVLHMDGTLCPLNSLILELQRSVVAVVGVKAEPAPEDERQMPMFANQPMPRPR